MRIFVRKTNIMVKNPTSLPNNLNKVFSKKQTKDSKIHALMHLINCMFKLILIKLRIFFFQFLS